jgi:hypothetical protein
MFTEQPDPAAQVVAWKEPDARGDAPTDHPAGEIRLQQRSVHNTRAAALAGDPANPWLGVSKCTCIGSVGNLSVDGAG